MKNKSLTLSGFTLVELQIALLILVLIGAVLMGALQLSAKSTKASDKLSNESSELRVISSFLKQQINSIMPSTAFHNNKSSLMFKGEQSSIYYVGHLPKHVVTGGPWLIHLYVDNKELRLDYKVINNRLSFKDNLLTDFESLVLLDNIDGFSLSYQKVSTSTWLANWQDKHSMPAMIKMNVQQNDKVWPELLFMVNSYAGTTTAFNVLTIQ